MRAHPYREAPSAEVDDEELAHIELVRRAQHLSWSRSARAVPTVAFAATTLLGLGCGALLWVDGSSALVRVVRVGWETSALVLAAILVDEALQRRSLARLRAARDSAACPCDDHSPAP